MNEVGLRKNTFLPDLFYSNTVNVDEFILITTASTLAFSHNEFRTHFRYFLEGYLFRRRLAIFHSSFNRRFETFFQSNLMKTYINRVLLPTTDTISFSNISKNPSN